MADKKIIAVVGATGAQGGGLVRAILADRDGEFAVRAITRKPDSDKGKALAAAGAEVVAGDADAPATLAAAFAGAHGVFVVTNFWEHFSAERELAQATAMARATRQAGNGARRLVDARGHAQVDSRSTTTACRRSTASTRWRTSTPRARPMRSSPPRPRRRATSSPRSTGTTSSTSAWGRGAARTASSVSPSRSAVA